MNLIRHEQIGFVEWLSVGSPSTSKNALTVGASCSDRESEGFPGSFVKKWGDGWPNDYPDPPTSNGLISGKPQEIAAFSGRGPADDYRIKPDVVAPGTNILSTRSSKGGSNEFWSLLDSNDKYGFMGGTSMATPLVTGCAALVRQWYRTQIKLENISSALLKATIINGTTKLTGASANTFSSINNQGFPNMHQGFGMVSLPTTLPDSKNFNLIFKDGYYQDKGEAFATAEQQYSLDFNVDSNRVDLRITLVWIDPPGRGIQNQLSLIAQNQVNQDLIYSNAEMYPTPLNLPDTNNNVQIIRVPAPTVGKWVVYIIGYNILFGDKQPFALVISGDVTK